MTVSDLLNKDGGREKRGQRLALPPPPRPLAAPSSEYKSARASAREAWMRQAQAPEESPPESSGPLGRFRPGLAVESLVVSVLREEEDLASERVGALPAGCRAEVVELGKGPTGRRLCVRTGDGWEGWVSVEKEDGTALWQPWVEVQIKAGMLLYAAEDEVRVFYDSDSDFTIRCLDRGDCVAALGPPVVGEDSFCMVPVRLSPDGAEGAVQRELLRATKPPEKGGAGGAAAARPPSGSPLDLPLVYRVPVAEDAPGGRAALRIVVYGDSFTAEVAGHASYAHSLVQALASRGIFVEVLGCGFIGLTAHRLAEAFGEPAFRDAFRQFGPGLKALARPRGREEPAADLALLLCGSADVVEFTKAYNIVEPSQVARAIKRLHAGCHELGVPTVALGLPDLWASKAMRQRLREVNRELARWATGGEGIGIGRPELFINSGALLPQGPAARGAGLWKKDRVHWSPEGSRAFGERLAARLAPLAARLAASRVLGARGAEAELPVEAYLQALALEEGAAEASPDRREAERPGDWELAAAQRLQAFVRLRRAAVAAAAAARRGPGRRGGGGATKRPRTSLLRWCSRLWPCLGCGV